MILTCPACSTKYVVKDGAIPAGGRQVRCASCKHGWHQDPEAGDAAQPPTSTSEDYAASVDAPLAEAPTETMPPPAIPDQELGDLPPDSDAAPDPEPVLPPERDDWAGPSANPDHPPIAEPDAAPEHSVPEQADDFTPFYEAEGDDESKRKTPWVLILLVLVAATAAAFWFLAPVELKQRVGIAGAGDGNASLAVMLTSQDRQKLASGNELLAVSGRVINPTDVRQRVPPIRAELLDESKTRVVYSWTIAPPAPVLEPGRSASFHSAEIDVPEGMYIRLTVG